MSDNICIGKLVYIDKDLVSLKKGMFGTVLQYPYQNVKDLAQVMIFEMNDIYVLNTRYLTTVRPESLMFKPEDKVFLSQEIPVMGRNDSLREAKQAPYLYVVSTYYDGYEQRYLLCKDLTDKLCVDVSSIYVNKYIAPRPELEIYE